MSDNTKGNFLIFEFVLTTSLYEKQTIQTIAIFSLLYIKVFLNVLNTRPSINSCFEASSRFYRLFILIFHEKFDFLIRITHLCSHLYGSLKNLFRNVDIANLNLIRVINLTLNVWQ